MEKYDTLSRQMVGRGSLGASCHRLPIALLLVGMFSFGAAARGEEQDLYGDPLPHGVAARLGTSRLNHSNSISKVAIHPDGRRIATLGRMWITVWDATTGQAIQKLHQQFTGCSSLDYSHDGRFLLAVGGNGLAYVYDGKTGRRLHTLQKPVAGSLQCGKFSPVDDEFLLASSDGVLFWRLQDGQLERAGQLNFAFMGATYSADGKSIVGWGRKSIRVIDKASGDERLTLLGHAKFITQMCVSPDGRWIASSGVDGTLRLWDANTGEAAWVRDDAHGGREVRCVAFSPNGQQLLSSGEDKAIRIWDLQTRQEVRSFAGLRHAMWSPDAARIVSCDGSSEIRLHDAATGELRPDLGGHGERIREVTFFDEGRHIATSTAGRLYIWDRQTGRSLHKCRDIDRYAIVPQQHLAVASKQGRLVLLDLASGEQRKLAEIEDDTKWEYDKIVVSPDGNRMATVEKISTAHDDAAKQLTSRITTWALPEAKVLSSVDVGLVRQIKFMADSRRVVIGVTQIGTDGIVPGQTRMELLETWSVDGLKRTKRINVGADCPVSNAVISQSGDRVALRSLRTKKLEVYDVNTGEGVRGFEADGQTAVGNIQMSQDGRWIATGMGTFYIWDASNGKLLHTIKTSGRVCSFSPDTTLLAVTGERHFSLWDIATGKRLTYTTDIGSNPSMVTFTPDGEQVVLRADDCCLWFWDIEKLRNPPAPPAPAVEPLADLWEQLGEADAKIAYAAANKLIERPGESVQFLSRELDVGRSWPALPSGADRVALQHDRTRFVLDQIGTEAAQQLLLQIKTTGEPSAADDSAKADPLAGEPRLPRGAVARFGTDAYRVGAISNLAFSWDGKFFATVDNSASRGPRDDPRRVKIWDVQTGRQLRTVSGPTFYPRWMELLPDSKSLVCAGRQQVEVVDLELGNVLSGWKSDLPIDAFATVADGKTVVTGHRDRSIHVRHLGTGEIIRTTEMAERPVWAFRGLGNSNHVAVINGGRLGGIWDTVSGKWVCPPMKNNYGFSNDGRFFAQLDENRGMHIRVVGTNKLATEYSPSPGYFAPLAIKPGTDRFVVFDTVRKWFGLFEPGGDSRVLDRDRMVLSPDGSLLAVPSQPQLTIWDMRTGQNLTLRANDNSHATDVVIASADGRRILTLCDGQVQLRDPDTFQVRRTLAMVGKPVALSHDGRFCAAINDDREAMVCETSTGTEIARLLKPTYHGLRAAFHPKQPRVVFAGDYSPAVRLDFAARKAAHFWTRRGDNQNIQFAADGRTAICPLDGQVLFRDTSTGKTLWTLGEGSGRDWYPQMVSADGRWITRRDPEQESFQVVDIRTGKTVAATDHDYLTSLAWSPDWAIYVNSDGGVLAVRDTESSEVVFQVDATGVGSLRLLPGGRHMATVVDGVTTVWDLATAATPRDPGESMVQHLEQLWPKLLGDDPRQAFQAEWAFVLAKEDAVRFIAAERRKIGDKLAMIDELIKRLDDDKFAVRRRAQIDIENIGLQATGPLERALADSPSAEVRLQARLILAALKRSPEMRRELRVARILSRIDGVR